MESNKENIENLKLPTRIPLPLDPLPAIPKHLFKESSKDSDIARRPLRVISNENAPGPSYERMTSHKNKRTVIVDARYVTLRPRHQSLGSTHKSTEDNSSKNSLPVDDCTNRDALNSNIYCNYNDMDVGSSSVTPSVKSPILEPSRVKNIKRSLRRPHSRELQGISPLATPENIGQKRVKRQLSFNDEGQETLQSTEFLNKSYMKCLNRDYNTDIFNHLITVERKPLDVPKTASITRACIINWIMKVNGADGNPAVVQSACWYLDSLLGTTYVELDKLQLLATACYWISQKLNGPAYSAKRLVKFANLAFSPKKLLAAEKLVLRKLKFPAQPVVPQDFIYYLSWLCDNDYPSEIEVAATFLSMSGLLVDKSLCSEYPSVTAAASVYNALFLLRKHSLIKHLQAAPLYISAQKKASDFENTLSLLRKAVRMVGSSYFEYKAPFEHYGVAPIYIAHRVVHAANDIVCPPSYEST